LSPVKNSSIHPSLGLLLINRCFPISLREIVNVRATICLLKGVKSLVFFRARFNLSSPSFLLYLPMIHQKESPSSLLVSCSYTSFLLMLFSMTLSPPCVSRRRGSFLELSTPPLRQIHHPLDLMKFPPTCGSFA